MVNLPLFVFAWIVLMVFVIGFILGWLCGEKLEVKNKENKHG